MTTNNKRPAWLWSGWIPNGMLTLLGGTTETTLSQFALDIAHRITYGKPLPDYPNLNDAQPVLYLDSSPAPPAKLPLWDKSLSTSRHFYRLIYQNASSKKHSVPQWHLSLLNQITQVKPALIIIDNLPHLTDINDPEIHHSLGSLNLIANRRKCAILIIHLIRSSPTQSSITLDDFTGAKSIVAIPRVVLALQQKHNHPYLHSIKNNLCPPKQPLKLNLNGDV